MNEKVIKAMTYAFIKHEDVNHRYNGNPYSIHLNMVYSYGVKYIDLIPNAEQDNILAACFTHDLIEDCRITFNDIKSVLGQRVAELTFALTNEKGKNRSERASSKYYSDMKNTPFATFVKICDRLANAQYSKQSKSTMIDAYKKEYEHFHAMTYQKIYESMFIELSEILELKII